MLILSRKLNETVYIGEEIIIKVVKIKGNVIGLGIEAPANIKVMRSELLMREPSSPEDTAKAKCKVEQKSGPLGAFTIAS